MPQRRLKHAQKQGVKISIHQMILGLGIVGLIVTALTFVTRWPYSLASLLGLDADIGIANLIALLRFPALIFFLFLTIYASKRCIEKYQQSFDVAIKSRR